MGTRATDRQLWWLDQGTKRPGPLATVDRDSVRVVLDELLELRQEVEVLRAQVGVRDGTGTVDQGRDTG
jgi:hypothetical protein